jgi:hypothetical protein
LARSGKCREDDPGEDDSDHNFARSQLLAQPTARDFKPCLSQEEGGERNTPVVPA